MKKRIFACIALLAVSAFAKTNSEEKKLMVKLGQANASEADLGRVVEPKATNADVKAFAKQMVEDHGKAFDQLKAMAKEEKVDLKSGMDAEHKEFEAKLSKQKHGSAYDRTYMDEMIEDHRHDKADVEKALKQIHDPDLKRWTEAQLTTIEHHLKMAEEVRAKLK